MTRRTRSIALALCAIALATPAVAKPLITSSEETTAQLCLDREAEGERLVAICTEALSDPGVSKQQTTEVQAILGDELLYIGRREDAAEHFKAALAGDPGNVMALNGMGWVHWYLDEEAVAATYFQQSVDLRPTAQGLAGLASSLWRSGQVEAEVAFTYLDAAVAVDPEYTWAARERGWLLLEADRGEEALAEFVKVIAEVGTDWNAEYGRSRALSSLARYEEALEAANAAILIDAEVPWAYAQRSFVLRALGRNAQALTEAKRVLEMAPEASTGHLQKALAERALGRRADAIATFAAADEAGVADDLLLYWYADVVTDENDMPRARALIERAIALDPRDPDHHLLRSWIALQEEAWADAMASAEAALALDQNEAYGHYYAAIGIANTGDVEEALARFDMAIEAGIGHDMINVFAADLIAAGKILTAVRLRTRY